MEALEKHLGDLCALINQLRDQIIPHCTARTECRGISRSSIEDSFPKIMYLTQSMWDDLKDLKASVSNDLQPQPPLDSTADSGSAADARREDASPRRDGRSPEQSFPQSTCVNAQASFPASRETVPRPFISDQRSAEPTALTNGDKATSNEQSTSEHCSDTALTSACYSAAHNTPIEEARDGCFLGNTQRGRCGEHHGPFVLHSDDMGERLVPAIMALAANPGFHGMATVDEPERDVSNLEVDLGEGDHYGVQHGATDGDKASNIWLMKDASSFRWPNFDELPGRPSAKEARDFLEAIVASPPEEPINYYGGSATSLLDNFLHPGRVLAQSTELQDMKSTYYHIGARGSATGFHCEDAEFWSCNITDAGYKIWLIIEPHHTAVFERFVRTNWTCGDCDQFVRHLCLLIAPSRLEGEGIDFSIRCAGPGEMCVTRPRQYHAVVNYTSCFARSINFVPDGRPLLPAKLVVCEQDGLYALHQSQPTQVVLVSAIQPVSAPDGSAEQRETRKGKRKALPARAEGVIRAKSARTSDRGGPNTTTLPEISRLARSLEKKDPQLALPKLHQLSKPLVLKLAAAIRGSSSAQQVRSLCDEQAKDKSTALSVVVTRTGNDDGAWESRIKYLRAATTESAFQKFKIRLVEHSIAEKVDEGKGRRRLRVSTRELDALADQFWPEDGGKQKLRYHLARGRSWTRICGPFVGLLAFIPLNRVDSLGISPKDYWALEDSDIERFHEMFTDDVGKVIRSMGKTVVETVLYGI